MKAARSQRSLVIVLLLSTLFLILPGFRPQALGSGPVGRIVGTVTDKSGASVSEAAITVTNQDTSENRTARTGSAGDFVFTVLPVGRYTVKVEKAGFQIYEQKNIILQVDQRVSVLPILKPGSVTQTVKVEATTEPPVNLTAASFI